MESVRPARAEPVAGSAARPASAAVSAAAALRTATAISRSAALPGDALWAALPAGPTVRPADPADSRASWAASAEVMATAPQGPDCTRRPGRADHHRRDCQRGRRQNPGVLVRPGCGRDIRSTVRDVLSYAKGDPFRGTVRDVLAQAKGNPNRCGCLWQPARRIGRHLRPYDPARNITTSARTRRRVELGLHHQQMPDVRTADDRHRAAHSRNLYPGGPCRRQPRLQRERCVGATTEERGHPNRSCLLIRGTSGRNLAGSGENQRDAMSQVSAPLAIKRLVI